MIAMSSAISSTHTPLTCRWRSLVTKRPPTARHEKRSCKRGFALPELGVGDPGTEEAALRLPPAARVSLEAGPDCKQEDITEDAVNNDLDCWSLVAKASLWTHAHDPDICMQSIAMRAVQMNTSNAKGSKLKVLKGMLTKLTRDTRRTEQSSLKHFAPPHARKPTRVWQMTYRNR